MKKALIAITNADVQMCSIYLMILSTLMACTNRSFSTTEETEIEDLIVRCYINGALNEMNTERMLEGYHSDFEIFFSEGDELTRLPLSDWIAIVNDYKSSNDSSGLRRFTHHCVSIDVTGNAAAVTLELYREGQLIFTDYITLLKFKSGWKIVTKIYHSHVPNPWKL